MADPPARDRPMTIEEYLAFEEASPVRHEYVDGEVHAMSGVTRRHSQISMNIGARIRAAVRGGPCRVHLAGVKLRAGNVIYYPDVMVACGAGPADERIEDAPCLVVEVLSESTASIDRREKLMVYRGIASLRAYLIVDQERRLVERHWRDADGGWRHATLAEQGEVPLPCPELVLTLDDVYEGVELPPPEELRRVREAAEAYG
ncbi:MAG TPA: Uma2 family endonuclease [Gemmatimonadaceae bacterium]|nr:Uma2 family endonuclease [Gemmatimonadaceae bacterium]